MQRQRVLQARASGPAPTLQGYGMGRQRENPGLGPSSHTGGDCIKRTQATQPGVKPLHGQGTQPPLSGRTMAMVEQCMEMLDGRKLATYIAEQRRDVIGMRGSVGLGQQIGATKEQQPSPNTLGRGVNPRERGAKPERCNGRTTKWRAETRQRRSIAAG